MSSTTQSTAVVSRENLLCAAAGEGDLPTVIKLLDAGIFVDCKNEARPREFIASAKKTPFVIKPMGAFSLSS